LMDTKRVRVIMLCLFVIVAISAAITLQGCVTNKGYQDDETGEIFTMEEFAAMTPEQQAQKSPVLYKAINQAIAANIDTGVQATESVITVVKPFIPEPYATGTVALLGFLATLWQLVGKRKIVSLSDKIKLGAVITKESVDAVVRGTDIWAAFKKSQDTAKKNTSAIMPDELT